MMRFLVALMMCSGMALAQAEARPIDTSRSKLTVYADKAGLFSFAGHDHTIAAPIAAGEVRDGAPASVALRVNAQEMKVLDPKLDADKRAEVQRDMHAKVLVSEQFPTIEFRSTKVTTTFDDAWTVIGDLVLRGQTKPVTVTVKKTGDAYAGTAKFKQTNFGITPISVAGGTIKVKDELKIEFEIYLQ
jgi:polyisoprenoid-binding protein YceI